MLRFTCNIQYEVELHLSHLNALDVMERVCAAVWRQLRAVARRALLSWHSLLCYVGLPYRFISESICIMCSCYSPAEATTKLIQNEWKLRLARAVAVQISDFPNAANITPFNTVFVL